VVADSVSRSRSLAAPSLLCGRRFLPDTSRTFHRDLNPLKVLGLRYATRDSERGGGRGYCLPSEWQYCSQGLLCGITSRVVGELAGRPGFCCPNFFPRTGTGAEACRLVKFLFRSLYFEIQFRLSRYTPRLPRRGHFWGQRPTLIFWCTSPLLLHVLF